jgi:hypothetical protein
MSASGMSDAAMCALIDVGTCRQGAQVSAFVPQRVIQELRELGMIGEGNGLTRSGTITRELLVTNQMDALFG